MKINKTNLKQNFIFNLSCSVCVFLLVNLIDWLINLINWLIDWFFVAEELGIVDDNSALIYGLAFGLGSLVVIGVIIGVLVYRHYKWKRFLNEPIPKEHYTSTLRNYPVTKKYYKKGYQSYAYTNVASGPPSRMSNDFETDEDLDIGSRPTTPSSSASKKNHLQVPGAKSGKINMNVNAGASNC